MKKIVSLLVPVAVLMIFMLLIFGCATDKEEENTSAKSLSHELTARPDRSPEFIRSFIITRPGQSEKIDIKHGKLITLEIRSHKLDNTSIQIKGYLGDTQIMQSRFIIGKKMKKYVIKPGIDQLVVRMINGSEVSGSVYTVNPNSAKMDKKDIYIKY